MWLNGAGVGRDWGGTGAGLGRDRSKGRDWGGTERGKARAGLGQRWVVGRRGVGALEKRKEGL